MEGAKLKKVVPAQFVLVQFLCKYAPESLSFWEKGVGRLGFVFISPLVAHGLPKKFTNKPMKRLPTGSRQRVFDSGTV